MSNVKKEVSKGFSNKEAKLHIKQIRLVKSPLSLIILVQAPLSDCKPLCLCLNKCPTDLLTATTTAAFLLLRYELIGQKSIANMSDAILFKLETAALPHSFYYCKRETTCRSVLLSYTGKK